MKEIHEVSRVKNNIVDKQSRRIELLEKKMVELRKKYFQLKYAGLISNIKGVL